MSEVEGPVPGSAEATKAVVQPNQAGMDPWESLDGRPREAWDRQIGAFRTRLWEEALRVEIEINGRERDRPTELTSTMIQEAYRQCTSIRRKTQTVRRVWRVVFTLVGGLAGLLAGVFSNHIDNSWGAAGPLGLAICAALFAASIVLSAVVSGDPE